MWDYVGIVRTTKRLQRAQNRIRLLIREIDDFYSLFRVSHDLIELRNLVVTADLIIRCALRRHESRGLHSSRNYPETLPRARNTVLNAAFELTLRNLPANAATGAADETAPADMLSGKSARSGPARLASTYAQDQINWLKTTVSAATRDENLVAIGEVAAQSPLAARRRPTTLDGRRVQPQRQRNDRQQQQADAQMARAKPTDSRSQGVQQDRSGQTADASGTAQ
jgi:hypothetical protein